jgi:hypothetical protein
MIRRMRDDLEYLQISLAIEIDQSIADGLKILLEQKHLYQNFEVDFAKIHDAHLAKLITYDDKTRFRQFASVFSKTLAISDRLTPVPLYPGSSPQPTYPAPMLLLQNVKLFCSHCGQRETFSPTSFVDVTNQITLRSKENHRIVPPSAFCQLFVASFQCETCRELPICVLVKRRGWKFTLEGRSPFEEVELPKFLPKKETWLFSDAIVAYQAGKTLAGLFYLRSFIEQFARRQTGITDKRNGDEILDAYQSQLPKEKESMPSLRSWYAKLSEPIHAAESNDVLFEEARDEIIKHFDFRRLFAIPDKSASGKKAADEEKKSSSE